MPLGQPHPQHFLHTLTSDTVTQCTQPCSSHSHRSYSSGKSVAKLYCVWAELWPSRVCLVWRLSPFSITWCEPFHETTIAPSINSSSLLPMPELMRPITSIFSFLFQSMGFDKPLLNYILILCLNVFFFLFGAVIKSKYCSATSKNWHLKGPLAASVCPPCLFWLPPWENVNWATTPIDSMWVIINY